MGSARNKSERRVSLAAPGDQPQATGMESAQRWAFIALLAWAPLPLGSARPWAWDVLGLLASALLFAAAMRELSSPATAAFWPQLRWPLALGAVLVAWILLQCLPQSLAGLHHPLWDKASEVLGVPLAGSISIARDASLDRLFRLLTYAGVFLLACQVGERSDGAKLAFRAILAIGAAYSIYGLSQFASPEPRILWFRKWAYVDDLTATFVNRNSFATFAGMTLITGLVPIAELLARYADSRSRATLLSSVIETLLSRGKWVIAGCLLTGSALLLSHSRGGALATVCGVLAFLALVMSAPSLRAPWRRSFGWVAGSVTLAALVIAGAGVLQRGMDNNIDADSRITLFAATLSAIRDNFLTGTGLGSFQYLFPMYQPAELGDYIFDLAHNDYLENMLELGVPAALLLFAILGLLVLACLRGVRERRRDALYPCAAVAVSVLVGLHSFVDFSLQIPAVSVTYAAILGIGVAQSVSSRRGEARAV